MEQRKKINVGSKVILTRIPEGLLDGLPEGDQVAIRRAVGKSSTFVRYDPDGRAELEFTDDEGVIHSIFVDPQLVRSTK